LIRYAALLRAVNLGGHNKLGMADLRQVLSALGYAQVVTHLQSGNAVFTCPPCPAGELERDISAAIAARLGVSCAVLIRTGDELAAVVGGNPLGAEPENPSRYFVAFLASAPAADSTAAFATLSFEPDKFWLRGREAYLWCPNGAAHTKLTNATLEKRLGVAATSRNWNTVTRLAELTAG
jgi:uncharacterized protein (DUF1697 family)